MEIGKLYKLKTGHKFGAFNQLPVCANPEMARIAFRGGVVTTQPDVSGFLSDDSEVFLVVDAKITDIGRRFTDVVYKILSPSSLGWIGIMIQEESQFVPVTEYSSSYDSVVEARKAL